MVEKGRDALLGTNDDSLDITFEPHDFFAPQPEPADVFILRHVCHDWPAAGAARILQNLVPGMKPSSRILLVELVTENPMLMHYDHARMASVMDLNMAQFHNATERTSADWGDVLKLTGEKLEILSITRPVGSWDSIIEIGFQ